MLRLIHDGIEIQNSMWPIFHDGVRVALDALSLRAVDLRHAIERGVNNLVWASKTMLEMIRTMGGVSYYQTVRTLRTVGVSDRTLHASYDSAHCREYPIL